MSNQLTLAQKFPSARLVTGSDSEAITSVSTHLKPPARNLSIIAAREVIKNYVSELADEQEFTIPELLGIGSLKPEQMVFLSHELIRSGVVEEITLTLIEGRPYPLLKKIIEV